MADDSRHGYNPANVEALSGNIKTAYENCINGILETLHDEIVVPISSAWYAPEACGFFGKEEDGVTAQETNLKQVVKDTSESIWKCFDGFREDIQKAGQNWYDNTSGTGEQGEGNITLEPFEQVELELDVSEIEKQDEAGNVVLDDTGVSAVSGSLESVQENIKQKMVAEKEQLDAATSFIGGGQAEAIQNCFERLLEAISTIFKWLSQGDESLKAAFDAAMAKYSEVATNIANAYNSATFTEEGSEGQ